VTTSELHGPRQVETAARTPQAPELVASAADALVALDDRGHDRGTGERSRAASE
jgi:hypothetical protein